MGSILIFNSIVNSVLVITSSIISGLYFYMANNWLNHWIFFIFNLTIALFLFYLLFTIGLIFYCNMILKRINKKKGDFTVKGSLQHLRVISNGLLSWVGCPLFTFFPFFVPFMGAKVGNGFVLMGKILNAELFTAGNNVVIGDGALIACHIAQAGRFHFGAVSIGDNVTVGVRSIIMPNVEIGSNSLIAANSVVKMGTKIPSNEVWGGSPAKKIFDINVLR